MARLIDKHEIKHELDNVYITFDGKRFLDLNEAVKHQKKLKNRYDYDK